MSRENLPEAVEEEVKRFASARQVSRTEAIVALIQAGLAASYPNGTPQKTKDKDRQVSEALRKIEYVREARAIEINELSKPNDLTRSLIGLLHDEPEAVDAIREAARERRRRMYGT